MWHIEINAAKEDSPDRRSRETTLYSYAIKVPDFVPRMAGLITKLAAPVRRLWRADAARPKEGTRPQALADWPEALALSDPEECLPADEESQTGLHGPALRRLPAPDRSAGLSRLEEDHTFFVDHYRPSATFLSHLMSMREASSQTDPLGKPEPATGANQYKNTAASPRKRKAGHVISIKF